MFHQNVTAAHARASTDIPVSGNAASAWLLSELRVAHDNLLSAMDAMNSATSVAVPDRDCYTNARWRLSQASLRRRTLWGKIFQHLLAGAAPSAVEALKLLDMANRDMLHLSAAHVGKWTTASIELDWRGYCGASRAVRWKMKACITTEKRILYPLLEEDAHGRRR